MIKARFRKKWRIEDESKQSQRRPLGTAMREDKFLEAIGVVLIRQKSAFVCRLSDCGVEVPISERAQESLGFGAACQHAACVVRRFLTVITISIMAFISSENVSKVSTFAQPTLGKAFEAQKTFGFGGFNEVLLWS